MNRDNLQLLQNSAAAFDVVLTERELALFDTFAEELKKWNRKINLTAIDDDREIVIKHFTDSLSLLSVLGAGGKLLDIGSGGGFPAIPLKLMLPRLTVISVDAVEKKILFQRHAARILRLEGFTALHTRVENLVNSHAAEFDCIVSRAFADLPLFVSLSLPLLKNSGRIIAMKGKEGKEEAAAAEKKLADLGARVVDCRHLTLPGNGADRYLVLIEKKTK